MKEELIRLYEEYLASSVAERTHELFEDGVKKRVVFKGDIEGFILYLKKTI